LAGFFRYLERSFGIFPVAVVAGLILFVMFVILLSYSNIRYMVEIQRAVQRIASGELDHRIAVRSRDEMGQLAAHINHMAQQLKDSIEQERSAVKSKQELITNVSHDLRTPLTSIMGYLQYMQEDRYKDETELRYYVDVAHQKAQRLNRLVNDLFDYTRMAYGQMPLNQAHINVMELLSQLAADFQLSLQQSGMSMRLDGPSEPVMIFADGDNMMRVFENLLSNAIRYGREGRKVDVQVYCKGGMAIVEVINYGLPIPAADLPFIFERFYRSDASRSEEYGGSGLGLAIVRSIVELHHGTITAASDEGRTCFEVRLPIAESFRMNRAI